MFHNNIIQLIIFFIYLHRAKHKTQQEIFILTQTENFGYYSVNVSPFPLKPNQFSQQ